MSHNHSHIISELASSPMITVEPVKGRDGLWGVAIATHDKYYFIPRDADWDCFVDDLLAIKGDICVWDVRRVIDWPFVDKRIIWDVRACYGGDKNLPNLVREQNRAGTNPNYNRFLELDEKMVAHGRALKTTKIPLKTLMAAPPELIRDWVKARTLAIRDLGMKTKFSSGLEGILSADYESRWPFIRCVHEMELNGIAIDMDFISKALADSPDQANATALRSLQGLHRDGMVTTLYNPMGGKTGRLRHEGGFNVLGIPKGPARQAIISRFAGGCICGFDFNAIDYRCIVNTVGGEVKKLYEGAEDFHERTASFVFKQITPATRSAIKFLSYIYIYGGSESTLVEKTGWTLEQVKQVLELLDKKIAPIKEFRSKLWMEAQQTGVVVAPGGRRVHTLEGDNEGKVIGLYAQTYSSWVFEQAVIQVQKMLRGLESKLIFTVHDELVIDTHPAELAIMEDIRKVMEIDGHKVKMKKGSSYGSLE